MKLEKALEYMKANASALDPALLSSEVGSFAIDSRAIKTGDVFFALSQPEYQHNGFNGEFEDSTRFVRDAVGRGALAIVARRERFLEHGLDDLAARTLFSDDVIKTLQALAQGIYMDWGKPVVAITGSAGKTTAKELTAQVLSASGLNILRNIKNYNNGLGHPLTVARLAGDSAYDAAVLEMGMSTPMHEIRRLCEITPPDVAVVLNVLPVHVEHLGSIENVAKAKAEIVEGMKPGGTAILNADDKRVAAMRSLNRGKTMTFGIENAADIKAENVRSEQLGNTTFDLRAFGERKTVEFELNGKHNVSNALSAAAVGVSFGLSLETIANALSLVRPPDQRGVVIRFENGFTVIDDSYNSNPEALLSMVRMVSGQRGYRRKLVVAGEMLELGPDAGKIHFETGRQLAATEIDQLIGVRGLAHELVAGAHVGGLRAALFAEDSEIAADLVTDLVQEGDLILIKGSRGVRTERVVKGLLEEFRVEGTVSETD